jgi:regulation of enolase protein 1 (concanavalin A-like superfamily)
MRAFWLSIFAAAALASPALAEPVKGRLAVLPSALTLDNPGKAAVSGDRLILTAPKGSDLYTSADGGHGTLTAPRVTFPAEGDFIFSAKAEAPFTANYDGPGLVLWNGDDYWAKLLFERLDENHSVVSSSFATPVSDNSYHTRLSGDVHTVWLKIVRAGRSVYFYTSLDGKDWQILRDFAVDPARPLQVGFLSQSPLGDQFTATFSDIRFEAKTFKSYWQGE